MNYQEFIERKRKMDQPSGFTVGAINPKLYAFQADTVHWALKRGRAALFFDCGLGKTAMQLEWARHVCEHTGGNVLILAPLAVADQTVREGEKFRIQAHVKHAHTGADCEPGITITNYERLHHFMDRKWSGLVLDESSILKHQDSKYRAMITEYAQSIAFRLACTATPAPNDHMELGNHSEFLSVMTRMEMLSMYFVHDGGSTQNWRLKRHAVTDFWRWVASWARAARKPSDLGNYFDDGFILPELQYEDRTVPSDGLNGYLFAVEAQDLNERRQARRQSLPQRVQEAARLVAQRPDEQWLIWCDLNAESDALTKAISGAVEVKGADSEDHKESSLLGFARGIIKYLVSKPSIAGHGLNLQLCHNMIFVGLSDSYEQFYQATRRCWRFGQEHPVHVYAIISEAEGNVLANIRRKDKQADEMMDGLVREIGFGRNELMKASNGNSKVASGNGWEMRLGDCVEEMSKMESDSIHYSIFSPPFASLYVYSDKPEDMGNCLDYSEFMEHFRFAIRELYRVLMPGRLLSFHCMNLPTSKVRDGVIGVTDFRGILIREFQEQGFIYHSEVCIWKDPVTAMQRTKALGLLHKQIKKDSAMCRQGIADYLVTMRKPGENPERISHTNESFPVELWQRYASPIWTDINPSDTLQRMSARDEADERHICPLQLEVIRRAIDLWTNIDDLVLSPFAGIGSEGHEAILKRRRFIGLELKESYFNQAVGNLRHAEEEAKHSSSDLLSMMEATR